MENNEKGDDMDRVCLTGYPRKGKVEKRKKDRKKMQSK
jgi:hypothetical protein